METESKYLKKIRDVLRKKNSGSSSGTIYSGPNTKAKYLNDIAKEVDKLDISGGGSSESPIFVVTVSVSGNNASIVQTTQEVDEAIENGKIIYLKYNDYVLSYKKTSKQGGVNYYIFEGVPTIDANETSDTLGLYVVTFKVSKNNRSIQANTVMTTARVTDITTAIGPFQF